MKDKVEILDSILRGIFYTFFVIFALVASFVPGALIWTAVVGATFLVGLVCTIHDSFRPEMLCSMCVFHRRVNGEAECTLKKIFVQDGAVCEDFVLRRNLSAS